MTRHQVSKTAFRSKADDASKTAIRSDAFRIAEQEAKAGHHSIAVAALRAYLDQDPDRGEAWTLLAGALKNLGDLKAAIDAYRQATLLNPRLAGNHIAMADLSRRLGAPEQALAFCETGLRLDPSVGEGHIIRAIIRRDLGRSEAAISDLRLVAARHPRAIAAHILLCDMLCGYDRLDDAADVLQTAIRVVPTDVTLHRRLSQIRAKQGRIGAASVALEAVVALTPGDAENHRCLAKLYEAEGRKTDAFDAYQKALAIDPKFCKAYINLASMLITDYRLDLAEAIFRVLLTLAPDDPVTYHNIGVALRLQNKYEEAAGHYRQALKLAPEFLDPLVDLCHIRQHFCDWAWLEAKQSAMFANAARTRKALSPFASITSTRWPAEHLANARLEASNLLTIANRSFATYAPRTAQQRQERLKIGYVSTDFHTHATAMLIVELLEHHDTSKFEIFGYSFGPDDASPLRHRIVATFDTFVDLRGIAPGEAARRIHADAIDILIDLKGYTQDARAEVFASRAAPIQVNYLGYPGTMGAPFMDYIIVDRFVAPADQAAFYDEKLVHLPHCYQPNDRKRVIAETRLTRADLGLPEHGFVFCCFNNSYKITETMFDLWMHLLRETPGSVLWLLEPNDRVAANLSREAERRGIAASRLIFAPRVTAPEHLARIGCADLFLDTLPVNAHTTASEALWVGLPVLTCVGEAFIGRVAGSLLDAIGVPELITTSLDDYSAKALALARDPVTLKRLRDTIFDNRLVSPLFDTTRYTRNFEAALLQMAAIRDDGQPPEAFAVLDQT